MSLGNRLSIYIALLIIGIFCAIGAIFMRYGAQREQRLMSLYAALMVQNSVERLDNHFSRVEERLIVAAPVARGMIRRPDRLPQVVEGLVRGDSLIMGGSVALRPGLLPPPADSLHMDYAFCDSEGVWQLKQLSDSTYDYTRMSWYTKAIHSQGPVWSEPYFDRGAGNEMMVTCSYPLRDDAGDFLGVITADISLRTLSEAIDRLRPIPDSYAFILSDTGLFVAHPDSSLVLSTGIFDYARRSGCSHLEAIGHSMLRGESDTRHVDILGEDALVVYQPVADTGWSICSVCPYDSVMSRLDLVTVKAVILLCIGLVIMLILIRLIIIYSMKHLVRLTHAATEIAAGDLNVDLPPMKPSDDIARLNNAFAAMQQSLRLQMERLVATTKAKEHIESELHIARNIQMSLVPHTFSPFLECERLELFATIRPAREVGGDLYDFFLRDNRLFFAIGDVSGKGVPASLFMAVTRTLFRSAAVHTDSPSHIVTTINDTILRDNDTCMFVTMYVGVLDLRTGLLTFCNAGHNPPVLIHPDGAVMMEVEQNLPVGVISGFEYAEQRISLSPGSKLFIYTDGLTEAENPDHQLYGDRRMLDYLSATASATPRDTIEGICRDADAFADGADQSDDLTMLSLRLLPASDTPHTSAPPAIHPEDRIITNTGEILRRLPEIIDHISSDHHLDAATTGRINLVLEEALANVVNYAYPHGTVGDILITYRLITAKSLIIFEITDYGIPFDPTAAPEPDIGLEADERPIGGLGIHLVRSLSQGVTYRRSADANILTITLSTHPDNP